MASASSGQIFWPEFHHTQGGQQIRFYEKLKSDPLPSSAIFWSVCISVLLKVSARLFFLFNSEDPSEGEGVWAAGGPGVGLKIFGKYP